MSTRTTNYEFELTLKDVVYVFPHTMPHTVEFEAGTILEVTCEVEYDYNDDDAPAHAVNIGFTIKYGERELPEPINPKLVKLIEDEVDDLLSHDEDLVPCHQIKEEDAISAYDDYDE